MNGDENYEAEGLNKKTGMYEVGCRQCGEGGSWKIYSDGKKVAMAECGLCGHTVKINTVEIKDKPDMKKYDLRMFT